MGAHNFIVFGKGKTAREAFDTLVREAEWEHGHDPYNGTISTTSLGRTVATIRKRYTPKAQADAVKFAENDDFGKKWESRAIDCGATKGGHVWAFYGWASC